MGITRHLGRKLFGVAAATAVILGVAVPLLSGTASAAGGVDDFNQCQNGPLATPAACTGSN